MGRCRDILQTIRCRESTCHYYSYKFLEQCPQKNLNTLSYHWCFPNEVNNSVRCRYHSQRELLWAFFVLSLNEISQLVSRNVAVNPAKAHFYMYLHRPLGQINSVMSLGSALLLCEVFNSSRQLLPCHSDSSCRARSKETGLCCDHGFVLAALGSPANFGLL